MMSYYKYVQRYQGKHNKQSNAKKKKFKHGISGEEENNPEMKISLHKINSMVDT